jgi:hypothetical protein
MTRVGRTLLSDAFDFDSSGGFYKPSLNCISL